MYSLKGKFVDFDNRWAYQCMDLAVDYVYHITNGKVRMWGNAKDSILNIFLKVGRLLKIHQIIYRQLEQLVYVRMVYTKYTVTSI